MTNNNGITLISLVVTVIILVVLSSVITYTGIDTIRNNKFEKLKYEMQIVQANVNLWYEETKNIDIDKIKDNGLGSPLPTDSEQMNKFQSVLNIVYEKLNQLNIENGITDGFNISTNLDDYIFFAKSDFVLQNIEGVENTYIIDIKKQVAILIEPYQYDNDGDGVEEDYYIIDQVKDIVR